MGALSRTDLEWKTTTERPKKAPDKQLLHLVIGGELESIDGITFKDLDKVDLVGELIQARRCRGGLARSGDFVDNAQMRYFVVHLHRLLDPETEIIE